MRNQTAKPVGEEETNTLSLLTFTNFAAIEIGKRLLVFIPVYSWNLACSTFCHRFLERTSKQQLHYSFIYYFVVYKLSILRENVVFLL